VEGSLEAATAVKEKNICSGCGEVSPCVGEPCLFGREVMLNGDDGAGVVGSPVFGRPSLIHIVTV
jgi:hypothetical protein